METTLIDSQAQPTTATSGWESPKSSRSSESPPTTGLRVSLTLMDPEDGCNNCGEKETQERPEKPEWSRPDSPQDPKAIDHQEDTNSTNNIIWGVCSYCNQPIKGEETIKTKVGESPKIYHARCLDSNRQLEKEREIYRNSNECCPHPKIPGFVHLCKNSLDSSLWDEKSQRYNNYLEFRGKRKPIQVELTKKQKGSSKPAKITRECVSPWVRKASSPRISATSATTG